jgi:hypothetical protein
VHRQQAILCDGRTPSTLPFRQVTAHEGVPPSATPLNKGIHLFLTIDGNGMVARALSKNLVVFIHHIRALRVDPRIQMNCHQHRKHTGYGKFIRLPHIIMVFHGIYLIAIGLVIRAIGSDKLLKADVDIKRID